MSTWDSKSLRADVVGGLTAAAVVIPKAMAYAVIAGLSVEVGLYTALAAMIVYSLLGSSRPLSVTTTSEIAMLTSAQVVVLSGSAGVAPVDIAVTLSLLVGALLVVGRIFRLGFVADFVSLPVLVGFKAGVGTVIIVGQLKSVFGVHLTSHHAMGMIRELPTRLADTHLITLIVALVGIASLMVLPRLFPRLSAPLVWLSASIAGSAVLGLGSMGVAVVGAVPPGLPSIALPNASLVSTLWPAALAIALMSFTETVAAGRAFARRDDPPIDPNRELVAVGAANLASALLGGMPSGGGTSQTAVADQAGVRSQFAQWVNAAVVAIVLLFLAGAIALLPQPALAALVIVSAMHMIEPESFRAIARVRRDEWMWALVTFAGVVLIGTLQGILIAVVVSVLTLIYQANHPPVYAVAYNRAKDLFRRVGDDPRDETFPGLLILRTEGRLTFANAGNAGEKMRALEAAATPRVLVLECSAIPDIEYTALTMLTEADERLRARRVTLWLAGLNPDVGAMIARSSLAKALGAERRFANLHDALGAWRGLKP